MELGWVWTAHPARNCLEQYLQRLHCFPKKLHSRLNPVDNGGVKYVDITNYLKMLDTSSSSTVTLTLFMVRRVRSNTFPFGSSTALGNSAGDSMNNDNPVEFYGSQNQNISN